MKPATDEQMREWVRAWERAGRELEAMRVKELQELSEADSVYAFNQLDPPSPVELKPSSGLVEQQAWFIKLAEAKRHESGL